MARHVASVNDSGISALDGLCWTWMLQGLGRGGSSQGVDPWRSSPFSTHLWPAESWPRLLDWGLSRMGSSIPESDPKGSLARELVSESKTILPVGLASISYVWSHDLLRFLNKFLLTGHSGSPGKKY